jgi:hypothetical protein
VLGSVLAVMCITNGVSAQEAAPGHYIPADLPAGIIDGFIGSVTNDEEWEVTDELAGAPHVLTAEESFVWAGSEIKAAMSLGMPTVTFSRPATNETPAHSFTLNIAFEKTRIIVRSSDPGNPKLAAGAALTYSEDKSFFKYIPGALDTGYVAMIPKSSPKDWYGIAICPRTKYDDKQSHVLSFTNYTPESVALTVQGELTAKQRTGYAKANVWGEVLTSPNIRRAIPFTREVTTENPLLQIQYFADSADDAAESTPYPYAGMRMECRMKAPQGAHRYKKTEGFVRAVPFTPEKSIVFYQDGNHYSIEAGQCFAIIRGVLFEEDFTAK